MVDPDDEPSEPPRTETVLDPDHASAVVPPWRDPLPGEAGGPAAAGHGSMMGTAPSVDTQGRQWQVAMQDIHAALFPKLGSARIRVGRFELLRRLGRGGMGEVYVAYDAQLDREVALKLLVRERASDPEAQERLLREAQVLARLSHPNVVQIYEAGIHEDQVYLVMELVEGMTLRQWLDRVPEGSTVHPWSRVLPVMIAAGRGLAAAHDAGLTHRDFKPDNVLVGNDGRVRVLDFGLARPGCGLPTHDSGAQAHTDPDANEGHSGGDSGDQDSGSRSQRLPADSGSFSGITGPSGSRRGIALLTEPGRILGTVPYMSPEQLARTSLDARSDQFGFCVTLYEALYGLRPFVGRTFAAQLLSVTHGKPREPEPRPEVPRWLRSVVLRGLQASPDRRFADMSALLRELDRSRGRSRALALATGGVLLGTVAVAASLRSTPEPCAQADAELSDAWDDEARARVQEAFIAAAPSFGAPAAKLVVGALDRQVSTWGAEQRDACEDTRVRGTHPEAVLAARTACIERNTETLRALLRSLPEAEPDLVERAHAMVEALPEPARCQDLDALGPEAPDDPQAVRRVREALASARVQRLAGRSGRAREAAEAALTRADATGYGPLQAEARVEVAKGLLSTPDPADLERAVGMLWDALDLAELHDHRGLMFDIWIEVQAADSHLHHEDRARLWARRAEVARQRSPGQPQQPLELAFRRGVLELGAGELQASERWLRQGLAQAQSVPGSSLMQARLLEALGNTLREMDRLPQAREAFEQSLRLWREQLGPEHPFLARHAFNLGLLLVDMGEVEAASQLLSQVRARMTALHGARSSWVGRIELALANLAQAQGQLDDAREHAARGRRIVTEALGFDDPIAIEALQVLGLVEFRRGDLQAAHDAWSKALAQLEQASSPDAAAVALTRSNLGETLLGLGKYQQARVLFAELLPAAEARRDQQPLSLMLVLKGLGLAELSSGRPGSARSHLAAALALLDEHHGPALERADLQWGLAQAERALGEPSAATDERAQQAASLYEAHGQPGRAHEIRAWLVVPPR